MNQKINLDEGTAFGLGAFETIAVEEGRGVLLTKHLARLTRTARFLDLGEPEARGLTLAWTAEQLRLHCKPHSVCKILLTRENLVMQTRPNTYGPERYETGFRMDFSAVRRNETSPLVGHKTLNYGDCILEHRAAAAAGMDERIFLNTRGKLAEGTVSNLFLVSGGKLYTPANTNLPILDLYSPISSAMSSQLISNGRCSHNPFAMAKAASGRFLANICGMDFLCQRSNRRN